MNPHYLILRTKEFAIQALKLAETLPNSYLGNHIKGQLIRCSTSVASNYRATRLAQSKAAFISKLSIVIEEVDEAAFWLEIASEFNLFKEEDHISTLTEAQELTAIFISTRKTMKLATS